MKSFPDKFTIRITKGDWEKAKNFKDGCNCIIATALKRKGAKEAVVDPFNVDINGETYYFPEYQGCGALKALAWADVFPFYEKEVIGRKIAIVKGQGNYDLL